MAEYIINFPNSIDMDFLNELGIMPLKKISCVPCLNCVVADLNQSQIEKLNAYGCNLTRDSICTF